MYIVLILYY
jgi:partner of Y14 and mago